MIRRMSGAGRWYSDEPSVLSGQIERFFSNSKNPGINGVFGGIVPHAVYDRSGQMAANTYAQLSPADYCIVLGFRHKHRHDGIHASLMDWETPFGLVKHAYALSEEIRDIIEVNEEIFDNEHSIELQLPFLKYLNENIRILPLVVGTNLPKSAAEKFAALIKKHKVLLIATTDFTHFGPKFNYEPFSYDSSKIKELDMGAIRKILNPDKDGFLKYLEDTRATICGRNVLCLTIDILQKLGASAHPVDYEISKQEDSSVSFASLVFA